MLACSSLVVVSRGISPIKKYLNFRLFFIWNLKMNFKFVLFSFLALKLTIVIFAEMLKSSRLRSYW